MVKVKSECGLTLKLFKDSQFEFIRPNIGLEIEVDNEKDIKPQLELAIKALKNVWDETTNQLSELVIAQMPQVDKEMQLQVAKKLQLFEKRLDEFGKQLSKK